MIMMMGSAAAVPTAPVLEQHNASNSSGVVAKKDLPLPRGLNNLGNTCYMNSVLQSFKVSLFFCSMSFLDCTGTPNSFE